MAEPLHRRAPLETSVAAFRRVSSAQAVSFEAIPFETHLTLRGDPIEERFSGAIQHVLGVPLPNKVGEIAGRSPRLLCLGPDEWLIVAPNEARAGLMRALSEGLADCYHAVVDVSASRTVIGLRGARARDVLAKGMTLDLHPRVFAAPRCAQTLFARVGVLLEQTDEAPSYRLYVRASFAEYVASWLVDAAEEFAPVTPARS